MGAATIEQLAEEAMTNEDFAAFLKRSKLTFEGAAGELGISRRLVAYYATNRPVPRYIALACRYIDEHRNGPERWLEALNMGLFDTAKGLLSDKASHDQRLSTILDQVFDKQDLRLSPFSSWERCLRASIESNASVPLPDLVGFVSQPSVGRRRRQRT